MSYEAALLAQVLNKKIGERNWVTERQLFEALTEVITWDFTITDPKVLPECIASLWKAVDEIMPIICYPDTDVAEDEGLDESYGILYRDWIRRLVAKDGDTQK